jgi:hypothetical protein
VLLSQQVESYRFWDVVTQWAREQLQHEHIVARALAKAVIRDGLRMQSVDPRWPTPGKALAHLQHIVERAATPQPEVLIEEFVTKQDFQAWLTRAQLPVPSFWFETELRHEG